MIVSTNILMAFAMIRAKEKRDNGERPRPLEDDYPLLERIMADDLPPGEEADLLFRVKFEESTRETITSAINSGVFVETPFESSKLYRKLKSVLNDDVKTADAKTVDPVRAVASVKTAAKSLVARFLNGNEPRSLVKWSVAAAAIVVAVVVGYASFQQGGRAREIELARAELASALEEETFDNELQVNDERSLVDYRIGFSGDAYVMALWSPADPESLARVYDAYDKLLALDDSDRTREEYARVALERGRDYDKAKAVLIGCKRESADQLALLGVAEFLDGDFKSALEYFQRARLLAPHDETLELNEAITLAKEGRWDEARTIYEELRDNTSDGVLQRGLDRFLRARE